MQMVLPFYGVLKFRKVLIQRWVSCQNSSTLPHIEVCKTRRFNEKVPLNDTEHIQHSKRMLSSRRNI